MTERLDDPQRADKQGDAWDRYCAVYREMFNGYVCLSPATIIEFAARERASVTRSAVVASSGHTPNLIKSLRDCAICYDYNDRPLINSAAKRIEELEQERDGLLTPRSATERTDEWQRRFEWLADKVIAPDYGDNDSVPHRKGYFIRHCKGPTWIGGETLAEAVDAVMNATDATTDSRANRG